MLLFREMFPQVLMPSSKELYNKKVPLACIGNVCEMCAGLYPTTKLETGEFPGEQTVNFGNREVIYKNDTKATKTTLNVSKPHSIACN